MRVSKTPEERKAELIQAARYLFDKQGVEKTRISDIVARVGVAQGVFYYYFASKDQMVDTVAELIKNETAQAAEAILQDETISFYGKLACFVNLYISVIDQFLGDSETSTEALQFDTVVDGFFAKQEKVLQKLLLEELVPQGVKAKAITAAYPKQTAMILLYGIRKYSTQKLPSRRMVFSILEQGLGMPAESLTAYASEKSKYKQLKNKGSSDL